MERKVKYDYYTDGITVIERDGKYTVIDNSSIITERRTEFDNEQAAVEFADKAFETQCAGLQK